MSKIKKTETQLLKKADIVFATSKQLYSYCSGYNANVHMFSSGVNIEAFQKAIQDDSDIVPDDIKDFKSPIIGCVGGVHKWVDQKLISSLAAERKELTFIFVGPVQTEIDILRKRDNVHFLGQKNKDDIPHYIKRFDVAIIPYRITDYTKCVYPAKLNEYLALGRPVVSTALPEIGHFNSLHNNLVSVGNDSTEFSKKIDAAISSDNSEIRKSRMARASENSWDDKIEGMCALIDSAIDKKRTDWALRWKENLVSFYQVSRRRIIKATLSSLLAYFLIFNTSLLWFLAQPLKISELPTKADAIVVFAAGVGESGVPGQGYEERVLHAVDLYQRGFAERVIFSSGALYAFKETDMIKTLALSLGLPERAILLEEEASSTYENVKFTKNILDSRGWKKILLVSSPYHMRRALLVWDKQSPDVEVTSTPISHSLFYDRSEGVRPRHIKGILHEYAGIVYYWIKDYI